jgi:hypothetical protein
VPVAAPGGESRADRLQRRDRHAGAEAGGELGIRVRRGRHEPRDVAAVLGDDQALARLHAVEVAAQVLAELTNTDPLGHCASQVAQHRANGPL